MAARTHYPGPPKHLGASDSERMMMLLPCLCRKPQRAVGVTPGPPAHGREPGCPFFDEIWRRSHRERVHENINRHGVCSARPRRSKGYNGRGVAGKCRGLTAVHRRQEQSEVTEHDGGIQGRTQVQTLHARVIILGPIRRIVMPACQHSYMAGQASSSHSGLVGGEALLLC